MVGEIVIANGAKETVASGLFETPSEVRVKGLSEAEIKSLECDHEEADTRLLINILMSPYLFIIVHCCDTDVLIILLANYLKLKVEGKTVFLKRRTGYINISLVAEQLLAKGINLKSLPLMHALSGCDTTSYFYGIGKTTAWATYEKYHVRLILLIYLLLYLPNNT